MGRSTKDVCGCGGSTKEERGRNTKKEGDGSTKEKGGTKEEEGRSTKTEGAGNWKKEG